ncbi:MAG TPA: trehalase family glycosidase [Candidatus Saccharimonadales bacterium]|nr:trehalase family glycosidase [Candidatus Saccharimonadales bacterium]
MLHKAKLTIAKARNIILPKKSELTAADVMAARKYIKEYWPKLKRYHPKDDETLLGLPKPYLVPAYEMDHEFDFREMYYWDSYFSVQGMLDEKHKELVTGILDDLLYMQKKYRVIPNASRTYLTGRSQPPLLTSFIFDAYNAYNPGKKWLKQALARAEDEYRFVWMGKEKPNARLVYEGLSRYYDINYLHDLAETESGWDMTPRFNRRAMDYLPVDLNALLYKYEIDLARGAQILGDEKTAAKWQAAAHKRQKVMDELMWSSSRNLYYDYNYAKQRRGTVSSLAAYYPMWAGMVDKTRAKQLVKSLRKFEQKGGLSATDATQIGALVPGSVPTQWAYPNGWAPLHFIVVQGLRRYGYEVEARRIALKWLKTNNDWFKEHGVFLEKYNVVEPDKPPMKGLYPSLPGFGWTNAVFERFCLDFLDL